MERRFVAWACEAAHPALREWYGDAGLADNLRREFRRDAGRMDDAAEGRRQREAHPVPGAGDRDYLPRILAVGDGRRVLAEIRFRADSLEFPHVLVRHRDHALARADDVDALCAALARSFAVFEPRRFCVFEPGTRQRGGREPRGHYHRVAYKRYVAAPVEHLRARPAPARADRLRLEPPPDLDFYDEYSRAYDEFWAAAPQLRDVVRKETPQAMADYLAQGALFIVRVGDRVAGVVAAGRDLEFGLRGWCVHERLLYDRFRGRGLGAALLWRFVHALPAAPDEALWGTIVPDNQPSLRSALRLGRVDVGGLFWLDPAPGT